LSTVELSCIAGSVLDDARLLSTAKAAHARLLPGGSLHVGVGGACGRSRDEAVDLLLRAGFVVAPVVGRQEMWVPAEGVFADPNNRSVAELLLVKKPGKNGDERFGDVLPFGVAHVYVIVDSDRGPVDLEAVSARLASIANRDGTTLDDALAGVSFVNGNGVRAHAQSWRIIVDDFHSGRRMGPYDIALIVDAAVVLSQDFETRWDRTLQGLREDYTWELFMLGLLDDSFDDDPHDLRARGSAVEMSGYFDTGADAMMTDSGGDYRTSFGVGAFAYAVRPFGAKKLLSFVDQNAEHQADLWFARHVGHMVTYKAHPPLAMPPIRMQSRMQSPVFTDFHIK
jgi:hypothetical protein